MNKKYSLEEFGVTRHEETLSNGLRVVFINKPFSPIYARIMMRAGSIYEPMDRLGLAHVTEHLVVAGSKDHSKETFSGLIESIGGYWNASTSEDWMSVDCEVSVPEHLSNMREYFSHALGDIYVTPEMLEKEKSIIISEIERAQSGTHYESSLYIDKVFGNGTHWGTPTLGTIESVRSITVEDVDTFFRTHCTVENMVLIVAGGCSLDEIKQTFGSIPFLSGSKNELPPDPEPLKPGTKITFDQDIPQTTIMLGFRGPEPETREDYLLGFALKYAHDGMTARFTKRIRSELGLAYTIKHMVLAYNERLVYTGTVTGVPTDRVQEAIEAIKDCYREFTEEGITQQAIDDKIDTQWFSSKRNKERSVDWVSTYDYDALYPDSRSPTGPFPDIYNYRRTYTAEEINAVLKKYITLDSLYLVLIGKGV